MRELAWTAWKLLTSYTYFTSNQIFFLYLEFRFKIQGKKITVQECSLACFFTNKRTFSKWKADKIKTLDPLYTKCRFAEYSIVFNKPEPANIKSSFLSGAPWVFNVIQMLNQSTYTKLLVHHISFQLWQDPIASACRPKCDFHLKQQRSTTIAIGSIASCPHQACPCRSYHFRSIPALLKTILNHKDFLPPSYNTKHTLQ